jgi:UDP-3-O-[3-hydroxymyristoyl] glucosamine N-acyltransferase
LHEQSGNGCFHSKQINMQFSALQIAGLIDGKVEGNPDASVDSFGKIEEARPGQLAFLANPKYEDHLYTTKASVILVNDSQALKKKINATLIRVPDAYLAFAGLFLYFPIRRIG